MPCCPSWSKGTDHRPKASGRGSYTFDADTCNVSVDAYCGRRVATFSWLLAYGCVARIDKVAKEQKTARFIENAMSQDARGCVQRGGHAQAPGKRVRKGEMEGWVR